MSQANVAVTKPRKIVNISNDYISTIAEKTKGKVRFSNKSFNEFLLYSIENSFVLRPTSSDEIGSLTEPQILEAVAGKEGLIFSRGACNF